MKICDANLKQHHDIFNLKLKRLTEDRWQATISSPSHLSWHNLGSRKRWDKPGGVIGS